MGAGDSEVWKMPMRGTFPICCALAAHGIREEGMDDHESDKSTPHSHLITICHTWPGLGQIIPSLAQPNTGMERAAFMTAWREKKLIGAGHSCPEYIGDIIQYIAVNQ